MYLIYTRRIPGTCVHTHHVLIYFKKYPLNTESTLVFLKKVGHVSQCHVFTTTCTAVEVEVEEVYQCTPIVTSTSISGVHTSTRYCVRV